MDLFANPTIDAVALLLSDKPRPQSQRVILLRRGDPDAPALYCVPGLGANATDFVTLARHLRWEGDIHALQPTGFAGDESASSSIGDMASDYLHAITEAGPFSGVLLGHSMGGLVALEMVSRLKGQGVDAQLVLLDTQLSQATALAPSGRVPDEIDALMLYFDYSGGRAGSLDEGKLRSMPAKRRLRSVLRALHAQNPSTREDIEIAQRVLKVYLAHLRAVHDYHFTGQVPERVVYVAPRARARTPLDDEPSFVAGRTERYMVAGDHLSMLRDPFAPGLAACLELAVGTRGRGRGLHGQLEEIARTAAPSTAAQRLMHADIDAGLRGYRQRHELADVLRPLLRRAKVRDVLDIGGRSENARMPSLDEVDIEQRRWLAQALEGGDADRHPAVYDAVAALGNGCSHCTPTELDSLFARASAALRPGGLLLVDLYGPAAFRQSQRDTLHVDLDPDTGVIGAANDRVDADGLRLNRLLVGVKAGDDRDGFDPPISARILDLYAHRPEALSRALRRHGFSRVTVYTADGWAAADSSSVGLLAVAEKDA